MSEATAENAIKVTLSTGKVILLRQLKIKHQTLASAAIGKKAGDNTMMMAMLMQQELAKILLISVDGKAPTGIEREDLDSILSFSEFGQLQKVINKMMGGDDEGEAKTEFVVTGKP